MKKICIILFLILISVFSFSESENLFGKFEIGENVVVNDKGEGDLVVAGREVLIDRNSSRRVIIAGEIITIKSRSKELYLAGKHVTIDGLVEGNLNIMAKNLYINAPVGGNLKIIAENVIISQGVIISGDIDIDGNLLVSKGAVVKGNIYYKEKLPVIEGHVMGEFVKKTEKSYTYERHFTFLPFKLFSVFYLFILTYIIFKLKKHLGEDRLERYLNNKSLILFKGFAGLVLTPVAAVLLFITILGFPIGILLILFYMILLFLATPIANLIIATKYFNKINFLKLLLSSLVLIILISLPFIGWLIKLFLILLGLGSLIDRFRNKMI
ncbi:polymer-forming cytoskeletal protein [Psychrilyobacter sp.]|uniref:polymer-forming cytoskeletal protein n=1 Tax=Psychrilyobacter sp. TaxID=2586924 RepID=UPI0030199CE1